MGKTKNLLTKVGNKVVRHTKWYQQDYWKGVTKFWCFREFGLDVVNLGSGAGVHAFNYDGLLIKGQNWALGPQSLLHDYSILRNYFSYIKEGGFVLVTICPFTCLVSHYGKEHNFRYYTILHPATIANFDDGERTRALTIKANPFGTMPGYCIRQTLLEVPRKIKSIVVPHQKALDKSAKTMMDGWKRQFSINDLSAPLTEKHKKEQLLRRQTLIDIVEFCRERSLRPVLVIPPMHPALSSMFPPEFRKNYIEEFIKGIDVPVYDYMYDDEIASSRYFLTALFLNKKGAKLFTQRLLKNIGLV